MSTDSSEQKQNGCAKLKSLQNKFHSIVSTTGETKDGTRKQVHLLLKKTVLSAISSLKVSVT